MGRFQPVVAGRNRPKAVGREGAVGDPWKRLTPAKIKAVSIDILRTLAEFDDIKEPSQDGCGGRCSPPSRRKIGIEMLLAKNCFTKDNLKTRKTIKLGTLYEYRKIESAQIVDSGEGKYSFLLKFDGIVEIERRWFSLMFQGAIGLGDDEHHPRIPGAMSAAIHNLEMVGGNEQIIRVRNSSASVHREALNGFIFCMSQVRNMRDAVGLFPDYDDCWYMAATKAHNLGVALSELLRDRITSGRDSGNHIVDPCIPLANLSIHCRHEPVSYLGREIHISDTSVFTADQFMHKIWDMAFVKPPSFLAEKEYRFSFTIVAGNKILIPIVDNLILNAEQLADWAL